MHLHTYCTLLFLLKRRVILPPEKGDSKIIILREILMQNKGYIIGVVKYGKKW